MRGGESDIIWRGLKNGLNLCIVEVESQGCGIRSGDVLSLME
jgi:hypothetical protein